MLTKGSAYERTPRTPLAVMLTIMTVLGLTACAVSTPVQTASPEAAAGNRQYQNIVFRSFTADPAVPNADAAILDCQRSTMDLLQVKNVYKRVEKQTPTVYPEPTLFVDQRLTALRIVSGTTRIWTGVLSGRSHIKVMVKLTDAQGTVVAEQELFGAPNAWGSAYSFGSSDRELPKNMGILVGDFILTTTGRK